jgi:hypothetical protein
MMYQVAYVVLRTKREKKRERVGAVVGVPVISSDGG